MKQTPCKECVFAAYRDNVQQGCMLSKIDHYKLNDVEIIDAYDNEKEFFVVNGYCNFYRDSKWLDKIEKANLNMVEQVNRESEIITDWVVHFDDNSSNDDLIRTLLSIDKLTKKPRRTIIGVNRLNPYSIRTIMMDYKLPWSVTKIVDRMEDGGLVDEGEVIRICLKSNPPTLFGWCKAGSEIAKPNIIEEMQSSINDKAKPVILSKDKEGIFVVYYKLAKVLGFWNLVEKIETKAKESNEMGMILQ